MDKGPEGDESDVPEWKKAGISIPHRTRQRILRMTKRMRGRKETSSSDPTVVMHLLSNLVQGSREDSFPLQEREISGVFCIPKVLFLIKEVQGFI